MIDYLEELLEEDSAVSLTHRPLGIWEETDRREAMADEAPTWEKIPGNGEETALGEPTEVSPESAEWLGTAVQKHDFPWMEQMARIQRKLLRPPAGQSRQGENGSLSQALRRAERMARAASLGRGTVHVRLPGEAATPEPLDVMELDRAVQRDARRYDGGFPLY